MFHRKWVSLLAASALLAGSLFSGCTSAPQQNQQKYNQMFFALNTVIDITVYNRKDAEYLEACGDLIDNYESIFSRTIETSEIALLNARKSDQISDETKVLLETGLYYSEKSQGAYDIAIAPLTTLWNFGAEEPKVPSKEDIQEAVSHVNYKAVSIQDHTVTISDEKTGIDLGSIAKGYIADRVKDFLQENGVEHALINLGGNVLTIGSKPDGSDFRIGIQTPFGDHTEYFGAVSVNDQSLVTSGVYERRFEENGVEYHHILNPNTGYPYDNGLYSVSILGPSSMHCDALSTTCFSLGLEEGMALIESLPDYEAVFVTEDMETYFSSKFVEISNYQEH